MIGVVSDPTPAGVVFSLVVSAMTLGLGFWMILAPKSYLRAGQRRKWTPRWIPSIDPPKMLTPLAIRLLGILLVSFVGLYLYAIAYNLSRHYHSVRPDA